MVTILSYSPVSLVAIKSNTRWIPQPAFIAEQQKKENMTTESNSFNPQELSSRKLWDIISAESSANANKADLDAAIAELEERRSYLEELQLIGRSSSED